MKKFILLLFIAVLASCSTSQFYTKDIYMLDFRPYAEKGFLMSTTTIGEKYQAIGEFTIDCRSGYDPSTGKVWSDGQNMNVTTKTKKRQWTADDVLYELYTQAKEVGSNAVINIHLETSKEGEFTNFTISGLAVKIE